MSEQNVRKENLERQGIHFNRIEPKLEIIWPVLGIHESLGRVQCRTEVLELDCTSESTRVHPQRSKCGNRV